VVVRGLTRVRSGVQVGTDVVEMNQAEASLIPDGGAL